MGKFSRFLHIMMVLGFLALLVFGRASPAFAAAFLVDLKTNYVPGEDFTAARTTVEGLPPQIHPVFRGTDEITMARIAEFELSRGDYRVLVELLQEDGTPLPGASRHILLTMPEGNFVVTALFSKPVSPDTPPEEGVVHVFLNPEATIPGLLNTLPGMIESGTTGGSGGEVAPHSTSGTESEVPVGDKRLEPGTPTSTQAQSNQESSGQPTSTGSCALHR